MSESRLGPLVPVFVLLSFALSAAHLWRAGQEGAAALCVFWALWSLRRTAWIRVVTIILLFLLAAEWFVTAGKLIQIRMMMNQPWIRLAAILLGVAAFTQISAVLVWERPGRAWFHIGTERSAMQAVSFLLVVAILLPSLFFSPRLLLTERLLPGFGVLQVFGAGLWGAWICGLLADRGKASAVRLRVWLLFSVVFFAQFALAAVGFSFFYMSGEPHIPVPGVIISGAVYRGAGSFMMILFLVSVLLAGSAWCSHLCYFGSWDARAASGACSAVRPAPHPHPLRWRVLSLALICCGALLLRLTDAPVLYAVAGGVVLGVIMVPVSLFISRKRGYAVYCTMICPLGLFSCLVGRISPWRIRRTERCILCGACTRACHYGALDRERLEAEGPGLSCTLCRACLAACPRGGLGMSWAGRGAEGGAERAFVTLISAMHAVFLFSAMV